MRRLTLNEKLILRKEIEWQLTKKSRNIIMEGLSEIEEPDVEELYERKDYMTIMLMLYCNATMYSLVWLSDLMTLYCTEEYKVFLNESYFSDLSDSFGIAEAALWEAYEQMIIEIYTED